MYADGQLRAWMEQAQIPSYSQLQTRAQLSRRGMDTLRQGRAETLRYIDLYRTSEVLQISLTELISACSQMPSPPEASHPSSATIRSAIQVLEPWLLQWPLALQAVRKQPDWPAKNLLPLLNPIDRLLASWQIVTIGNIGEETPFDPQWHQPLTEAIALGETVVIRYPGYRLDDRLLYRAKVESVKNAGNVALG